MWYVYCVLLTTRILLLWGVYVENVHPVRPGTIRIESNKVADREGGIRNLGGSEWMTSDFPDKECKRFLSPDRECKIFSCGSKLIFFWIWIWFQKSTSNLLWFRLHLFNFSRRTNTISKWLCGYLWNSLLSSKFVKILLLMLGLHQDS